MNIVLWVLQILLALHTITGAVWKFSKSPEHTMPSLKAIPVGVWIAMAVIELLCSLGLILPALSKPLAMLAPIAAVVIALEMVVLCGVHLTSGATNYGPIMYWVVVAAVCTFVAYGRFVSHPL